MTEPKRGPGRKKGDAKTVLIRDAVLEPFYINVQDKSFNVFKEGDANGYCYCTTLSNALDNIVKFQLALAGEKDKTYSLSEYIEQYQKATQTISSKIKF